MMKMNYAYLICHRKPERSFHIKGHQFPVCARCTGFYVSFVLYCIYAYFNYIDYSLQLLAIALCLLIPAGVDGFTQFFELRESNNTLRFLTGFCGGLGLAILIKSFKFFILHGGIL